MEFITCLGRVNLTRHTNALALVNKDGESPASGDVMATSAG